MKFCQLLTLFLSVITIAFTQDAGPDPKLMATLEQILCLGKTPLTEEQSASILTKCPCDKQSIVRLLIIFNAQKRTKIEFSNH
jgi:hypothetical protein